MSTSYEVAIEYMQRPFKFTLPPKHKGESQSWAHDASDRISHCQKQGGFSNELFARIEALVFPLIVSCSVLQKLGTTLAATTNYALGHQHKDESISKEARELFLLVGALFYSVFAWLPSIIDPTILAREERTDKPPTTSEEEFAATIKANAQLRQKITTAKKEAIAIMFPIISKERVDEVRTLLQKPELHGIELTVSPEPSGDLFEAISQASWGTPVTNGEHEATICRFEHEATICPQIIVRDDAAVDDSVGVLHRAWDATELVPELANPDFVVQPKGMISLSIDCRNYSLLELKSILEKGHKIGELKLLNADQETLDLLLDLDELTSTLANIHNLVLDDNRGHNHILVLDMLKLNQLSQRFPGIACFDLRTCRIQGDTEELCREHIVFHTTYDVQGEPGRVKTVVREPHNNVLEQLNSFNQKIFAIVNHKKFDVRNSVGNQPTEVSKHFTDGRDLKDNKRFHCFAPFITKLSFLRGTGVRSNHLKLLMPKLSHSFPNLQILDLGYCIYLDSEIFQHLRHYPVSKIYLHGCDAILGQQLSKEETHLKKQDPEFLFINQRGYLLRLDAVASAMLYLFGEGTNMIRLDGSQLSKKEYTQQTIDGIRTYEQYARRHFTKSLYPGMDSLAQPPLNNDVIVFWTHHEYRGI